MLRADSGFARDALIAWCEANRVDLVFGLARNARLAAEIEAQMAAPRAEAEWLPGGSHSANRSGGKAHSRFVVTSQTPQAAITPDQHRSCGDRPTAPVPLH